MKKSVLSILVLLIGSFSAFSQWTTYSSMPSTYAIEFNFLNDDIGYARTVDKGNEGNIFKTINGGTSWTAVNLPDSMPAGIIDAFHFYGVGNGVMSYSDNSFAPHERVRIHKTTNDGMSWTDITPDTSAFGGWSSRLHFTSNNIGFFAFGDSIIRKTIDGGQSWSEIVISSPSGMYGYSIMDMHFYDANHGIVGVWDNTFSYRGAMFVTSDGGDNWNETALGRQNTAIGRVVQASQQVSYASPIQGAPGWLEMYKSTDMGMNWDTINVSATINNARIVDFDFWDENKGVVLVRNGWGDSIHAYYTDNGASSWRYFGFVDSARTPAVEITPNSGYVPSGFQKFSKLDQAFISIEEFNTPIGIYPNPVVSGGTLQLSTVEDYNKITMYHLDGRKAWEQKLDEQMNLQLPKVAAGTYIISLVGKRHSDNLKIVVQ